MLCKHAKASHRALGHISAVLLAHKQRRFTYLLAVASQLRLDGRHSHLWHLQGRAPGRLLLLLFGCWLWLLLGSSALGSSCGSSGRAGSAHSRRIVAVLPAGLCWPGPWLGN